MNTKTFTACINGKNTTIDEKKIDHVRIFSFDIRPSVTVTCIQARIINVPTSYCLEYVYEKKKFDKRTEMIK